MNEPLRAGHEFGSNVFDGHFTAQLAACAPTLVSLAAQINALNTLAYGVTSSARQAHSHRDRATSLGRALAETLVATILDQPLRVTPDGRVVVDDDTGHSSAAAMFCNRLLLVGAIQAAVTTRLAAVAPRPPAAGNHPHLGRPFSEHYAKLPYADGLDLAVEIYEAPPAYAYLVPHQHRSADTESD